MFSGKDEICAKLDHIHEMLLEKSRPYNPNSNEVLKQFKTLFKYLAFVASAAKIPIGPNLFEQTKNAVQKIGTAENIHIWSWTPQQLNIVSSHESMKRVALCGGNGTGKTLILREMAKIRAREGKKVVYIILTIFSRVPKTLLYYQLKYEFKNTSIEIRIYCTKYSDSDELEDLKNAYIFIDEIVLTSSLKYFLYKNNLDVCSSVWMASGLDPRELNECKLPSDFQIISLDLSLRTTKVLTNFVTGANIYDTNVHHSMVNSMNRSLKCLPHMPVGKKIIRFNRRNASESNTDVIQRALAASPTKVLIGVYLYTDLKQVNKCFSKDREPLISVYHQGINVNNSKDEDIEKWVTNHPSMKERALIANECTAPGFEAEVVMSIGSATRVDVFMSRARVQYIMVNLG